MPAWPTEIVPQESRFFERNFAMFGPRFERMRSRPFESVLPFSLLMLAAALTLPWRYRKGSWLPKSGLLLELVAGTVLFLYFAKIGPWAVEDGFKSSSTGMGFVAYDVGEIGNYDVKVIRSKDGRDVLKWLGEHRFQIQKRDPAILAEYAARGWCFLAARFRKELDGVSAPHPIRIRFPAQRAIYPMRLTGTHTNALRLELLTVGEFEAVVPQLETWRCFEPSLGAAIKSYDPSGQDNSKLSGAVATYLRSDLSGSALQDDIKLSWRRAQPHEVRVLHPEAYRSAISMTVMIVVPIAAMILSIVTSWMTMPLMRALFLSLVGAGLVSAFAVWIALHGVKVLELAAK